MSKTYSIQELTEEQAQALSSLLDQAVRAERLAIVVNALVGAPVTDTGMKAKELLGLLKENED